MPLGKIEDFSKKKMRSLPLALALVFSIPFGIRMPFGLWHGSLRAHDFPKMNTLSKHGSIFQSCVSTSPPWCPSLLARCRCSRSSPDFAFGPSNSELPKSSQESKRVFDPWVSMDINCLVLFNHDFLQNLRDKTMMKVHVTRLSSFIRFVRWISCQGVVLTVKCVLAYYGAPPPFGFRP